MLQKGYLVSALAGFALAVASGCGGSREGISVEGSDTMVNLAQAWAERYRQKRPDVTVQVQGGGSGVGIAGMIDGKCDLANASREMKDEEKQAIQARHGKQPKEHIVGFDALAVYVHKDNPLDSISLGELAEIYGEHGTITHWSQLGVGEDSACYGEIAVVSRQNSSGTYFYFREKVLGGARDYNDEAVKMSGSKEVIEHVANTPQAIGYSGMGYHTDAVKMLEISVKKGEPGVAPTVENAQNKSYPITRPLRIYTVGEPTGQIKEYLDWIHSPEGQAVVAELDYVPLQEDQ